MVLSPSTRLESFSQAHPILCELVEAWVGSITLILLSGVIGSFIAFGDPISLFLYDWKVYPVALALSLYGAVTMALNNDGSAY